MNGRQQKEYLYAISFAAVVALILGSVIWATAGADRSAYDLESFSYVFDDTADSGTDGTDTHRQPSTVTEGSELSAATARKKADLMSPVAGSGEHSPSTRVVEEQLREAMPAAAADESTQSGALHTRSFAGPLSIASLAGAAFTAGPVGPSAASGGFGVGAASGGFSGSAIPTAIESPGSEHAMAMAFVRASGDPAITGISAPPPVLEIDTLPGEAHASPAVSGTSRPEPASAAASFTAADYAARIDDSPEPDQNLLLRPLGDMPVTVAMDGGIEAAIFGQLQREGMSVPPVVNPVVVNPEPATLLLLGTGLFVVGRRMRRR